MLCPPCSPSWPTGAPSCLEQEHGQDTEPGLPASLDRPGAPHCSWTERWEMSQQHIRTSGMLQIPLAPADITLGRLPSGKKVRKSQGRWSRDEVGRKRVWMEFKEPREEKQKRQEKRQVVAGLSGCEHREMFPRTPVSAAPSQAPGSLQGSSFHHREGRRCGFGGTEQEQGADRVKGSTSGAEFCRQRVKQWECEDKPTSMAAGCPRVLPGRGCARGLSVESCPRLLESSPRGS